MTVAKYVSEKWALGKTEEDLLMFSKEIVWIFCLLLTERISNS